MRKREREVGKYTARERNRKYIETERDRVSENK